MNLIVISIWAMVAVTGIIGLMFASSGKKKIANKNKWVFAAPLLLIAAGLILFQTGALSKLGVEGAQPFAIGDASDTDGVGITGEATGEGDVGQDLVAVGSSVVVNGMTITPEMMCGYSSKDYPSTGYCQYDGMTGTISSIDKYTSVATGDTHRYSLDGAPAKTVSDAGTISLSYLSSLKLLYGNESGNYFGTLKTCIVPCVKYPTFSVERVQNGSVTMNVYTEGGDQIDGGTYNETLAAGDTPTLKLEIYGQNQRGFPNGGLLSLEVNGSDYDEENIVLELGDISVTKLTSTPSVHTLSNVQNKVISWYVSPFEGTKLHTGSISLDVDNTNNPGDLDDPVLTFRPYDYIINEDNGGAFEGPVVQDEDNVAAFGHTTTKTIHVM